MGINLIEELAKLSPDEINEALEAAKAKRDEHDADLAYQTFLKKFPKKQLQAYAKKINQLSQPQEVKKTLTVQFTLNGSIFWEEVIPSWEVSGWNYKIIKGKATGCDEDISNDMLHAFKECLEEELEEQAGELQDKIDEVLYEMSAQEEEFEIPSDTIWNHLVKLGLI